MKILLLTTVYPRPDAPKTTTATRVIHYFSKSWQELGHEVVVIHTVNRLPRPLYYLPGACKRTIKKKTGFEVPNAAILREISYEFEGIPVYRKCLYKFIPQHLSSDRTVRKCAKRIHTDLERIGFAPDLIVGHWASPNAQLLEALRAYYTCPNGLVLHGEGYVERYPEKMGKLLRQIDRIGCRSATLAAHVQQKLALENLPFVCYSGIPDGYVAQVAEMPLAEKESVTRFLYVGELIERKHTDTVIRALADHTDRPWTLDVVGVGDCRASLEALVETLAVKDRVTFHGRLPREQVLELMQRTDVFTMVSRGEAFGLVYLEAMAAGALTVGSLREGIDGVIIHGENGFLIEAGDAQALSALYTRLFAMSPAERLAIAKRAAQTAAAMTDTAVAERYLQDLLARA